MKALASHASPCGNTVMPAPREAPYPIRLNVDDRDLLRRVASVEGTTPHATARKGLREWLRERAKSLRIDVARLPCS